MAADEVEGTMDITSLTRKHRVAVFTEAAARAREVEAAVHAHPRTEWVRVATTVDEVLNACDTNQVDVIVVDSDNDPNWNLCLLVTKLFQEVTVVALLGHRGTTHISPAWALLHGAEGVIGADAVSCRLGKAITCAATRGHYVDADLRAVAEVRTSLHVVKSGDGTT
ncbi:MAG TPA: hypothetical protein VFX16_36900 [Pseudonocardiaceae bacterium]|nr:hypothetical protein [Pseudonocardiaceae bacterium]